ncbi:hypothetical protein L210DRAFT_939386 [Boletus edulis BED1]|uniref:Uncharacterized protein n=1 Tax=Boletus edulis BED1 TaxID=1328754 RepID=A0AAD4C580_BOLED|nr:hypothetical protein L210DRAFT_939386 [Boletus edulis BED1]
MISLTLLRRLIVFIAYLACRSIVILLGQIVSRYSCFALNDQSDLELITLTLDV